MSEQLAIKIQGLKKQYRLGQIGGGTLTADLQSWWARVRHKEDPNSKIGTDQRLIGQTFMALNGIDLEVKKGEALGIIGGNGAGKSTMLKILSRITAPTEGAVDIYGRITSMLEVGTGFSGEMTGRENVYMNGAILGMTKAEIDAKMEDIIEFSEVREFIDTPVKRYSSGMYVKLAFSVAAHLDSEIMIMDEVLAVGDMAFQQKCLDKMRDAATVQGKTVLYVSHNMNTIRKLCDRCIVLDQGRIIFDGDVDGAISVYLGKKDNGRPVEFDLSKERMSHLSKRVSAKMMHLSLLNKESAVYQHGEAIRFRLTVKANEDIPNFNLRAEVRTKDDLSVGAAMCPTQEGMKAGEVKEYVMSFNTPGLVQGFYKCLFVIYGNNPYGGYTDYDAIWPAFCFELESDEGINWNSHHWGSISFPELVVES
ncbi:MAG: ATP-binding cassette domain-containing protein [Oscillospiraceae bacterium]|nr:ATP-binding cassette domain-containing protein [Oscillospiraceae bacterium]